MTKGADPAARGPGCAEPTMRSVVKLSRHSRESGNPGNVSSNDDLDSGTPKAHLRLSPE